MAASILLKLTLLSKYLKGLLTLANEAKII